MLNKLEPKRTPFMEFIQSCKQIETPKWLKVFGENETVKIELNDYILVGIENNGNQHWLHKYKGIIIKMNVN